ncbi:G-protein coupled receptor dmsr-1-like [Mercenaria mercenaria]|uniref:G-protein coupled receptor dmsr-1-like n=1 Tax=Mercenaria mercenaria TaxID=6596 RepID=UPI00234F1049|nr:G-protein coupled receptor dmsr-1-like [Mercenaria mercenaria]
MDIICERFSKPYFETRCRNATMNSTVNVTPYKSENLEYFSITYSNWHGYISLITCAIGIPLNIINIIVLTRKNMQTPINCILTWLAVADTATMISYVPFSYHFYCRFSAFTISSEKNSWVWMHFLLIYLNFSSTAHTIAIWLAVALAIMRHHHLHSPAKGSITRMRRLIRARLVVCVVVCTSVILLIPNYLSHNLEEVRFRDNTTGYVFEDWEINSGHAKPIRLVSLIVYGSLAKILPCALIIIFGSLLLRTLNKTMQNRRHLSENGVTISARRHADPSRTTSMLLVVIVLFLITELPQGILIMCCIFLQNFFENIYIPLGDVMDMLALLNNSINFVLYCTMSQEFRSTFIALFCSFSCTHERRKPYISSHYNGDHLLVTLNSVEHTG